ncbi:hypothetical protein C8J56DRAFT_910877 [Mycena floridula]|nr:hypothetical protein C8J56DRAFT_910877 [Mycena floridula]
MDAVRRRNPFRYQEDEQAQAGQILDEQEQEELIQRLRSENASYDQQYKLFLQAIVIISGLFQLVYFFNPSPETPLHALFPDDSEETIPVPRVFTVICIMLHLNLSILLRPSELRQFLDRLEVDVDLHPISYSLSYALAAVAPTLCLFVGHSWPTVAWWSLTGGVIFTVQTAQTAIDSGNESISSLEAMKYVAPSA